MRVLIIDDGQSGDEFAHHLKTMYGAETFIARSPADGIKQRQEIKGLNYIVLDLSFPDLTKEETVDCIPQIADGLPLFVFTGYEDRSIFQRAMEIGAADCFLKGDNHRGGSALGSRIASDYYRKKHPAAAERDRVMSGLFEVRKEQAASGAVHKWLSPGYVSLMLAIGLQLVALFWFMVSQSGSNALFRKQVTDNTSDIAILKTKAEIVHDQNQHSIEDREHLTKRLDEAIGNYNTLRSEMNIGFQRIYDVLLQDRKANQENREIDRKEEQKKGRN